MRQEKVDEFFEFARERHRIYERRQAGLPWPWTEDVILRDWYFTNVYRELDRTTQWYRQNVRDHLRSDNSVLPATVLFRWFNRISIGEYIFTKGQYDGQTLWEQIISGDVDADYVIGNIRNAFPKGPYVNGAYIIKGYDGMDKLSGVVHAFYNWFEHWRRYDAIDHGRLRVGQAGPTTLSDTSNITTMEGMTKWLATFDQLGMFMAYEITCDLRFTQYLENAPDIKLWANPGPGARRGLSRLWTDSPDDMKFSEIRAVEAMRKLLSLSPFPDWEMREVEHTLCEFDKYERIRQGGRGKRIYRP